jgi:coenzyme F420-reducing hydrogenase delta subunit
MAGLREWMSFEPNYIQKVACKDEVDVEIITCLMQKGVGGLLPSVIASELAEYGLKRWDVTRRIQRMNKKLLKELGQKIAEKRGQQWGPTSFLIDLW